MIISQVGLKASSTVQSKNKSKSKNKNYSNTFIKDVITASPPGVGWFISAAAAVVTVPAVAAVATLTRFTMWSCKNFFKKKNISKIL